MRCFIAIDLPEKIKYKFREIKIDRDIAEVSVPDDYHLTLKFLGEINKNELERTKRNIREVRFRPLILNLENSGYFPNDNYIEVAWVGVTPKSRIIKLKEDIDDALMGLFQRDKRFTPHITLYRVKKMRDKNKFKDLLNRNYESHWKVNSFVLYESRMENGRHRYYPLEEYS
ncbi:RNA 2',3'-cyclic phosphodiesterase [Candidatus Woesearchaeota archaeon]|nr:RNA 2',3'-cyclic phosphodiesterase [Candidatus Woesearchaeota archaeon]